jgi:hypothetical protein
MTISKREAKRDLEVASRRAARSLGIVQARVGARPAQPLGLMLLERRPVFLMAG